MPFFKKHRPAYPGQPAPIVKYAEPLTYFTLRMIEMFLQGEDARAIDAHMLDIVDTCPPAQPELGFTLAPGPALMHRRQAVVWFTPAGALEGMHRTGDDWAALCAIEFIHESLEKARRSHGEDPDEDPMPKPGAPFSLASAAVVTTYRATPERQFRMILEERFGRSAPHSDGRLSTDQVITGFGMPGNGRGG